MDCSLPGSSVHGIFQARVLIQFILQNLGKSLNEVKKRSITDILRKEKKMKSYESSIKTIKGRKRGKDKKRNKE